MGFKEGEGKMRNLRYADDILLITETKAELINVMNKPFSICNKYGMKKTTVMYVSKQDMKYQAKNTNVRINNETLEEVQEIAPDARCKTKMRQCINHAKKFSGNTKTYYEVALISKPR